MGNKSNYYIDNLIGTKGTKNVYILGGQASVNNNVVSDTINKANALDTIKSTETNKITPLENMKIGNN